MQVDIAIENGSSKSAYHDIVVIFHKGKLLNLGACHVVSAANLTVDMLKVVVVEVMRLILWHFRVDEIEPENALVLCLIKGVVLPGELRSCILFLHIFVSFSEDILSQHAIVGDIILRHRSYTSIDVNESTVLSDELISSDGVVIHLKCGILHLAIILKQTSFVLERLVGDHLHVQIVRNLVIIDGSMDWLLF